MKKLLFITMAMILFVGLGNNVMAQAPLSRSAEAKITIVKPVTFTADRPLDFGSVANSAGAATIAPDNAGAFSGTAIQLVGPGSSAKFTITGIDGSGFAISMPNATVVVTNTAGAGETMTISVTNSGLGSYLFDATTQSLEVFMGGTLNVAANQVVGLYRNATDLKLNLVYE
jgi:hypothetical protein